MTTVLERSTTGADGAAARRWRSRLPWWVEAVLAVAAYELYGLVQGATDSERGIAVRHGWALIHVEKRLHLWLEPTVNGWFGLHRLASIASDYYYELTHVLVTGAVLVWLWRRHPSSYMRWRNILLVLSLLALVVFWLYPVAPPRLTTPAVSDLLVKYDALGAAHPPDGLIDLYAALPSLHVAWAVWCAGAVIDAGNTRWRGVAVAYPLATSFAVIGTANHYVLDVAAGASLTLVTALVAKVLARQPVSAVIRRGVAIPGQAPATIRLPQSDRPSGRALGQPGAVQPASTSTRSP